MGLDGYCSLCVDTARNERWYAVRVVGPAGRETYMTIGGGESDRIEDAFQYQDVHNAIGAAAHYQRTHNNVVCGVVNVNDPEDKCTV